MSGFSINSKSIFLTVPQCETPLEEFAQHIREFFGDNLEHGIACQERHQDGNSHLHAALTLRKPFRSRDVTIFDQLAGKHPNIEGRFKGGPKRAYEYVAKEGNYCILPTPDSLELDEFLNSGKKETKASKIARMISSGSHLDEVDEEEPGYLLQHLKSIQHYESFRALKAQRAAFAKVSGQLATVQPVASFDSSWNRAIASWWNQNLRVPRVHRQKQLWLVAKEGAGKTIMIEILEKAFGLSIYYWPTGEAWNDAYQDGTYDMILFDEFHGSQITITRLNQIASGDTLSLSRRGAPPILKRDKLPIVVLSNYTPSEAYANSPLTKIGPLLDRFTVVTVPERGKIRIEPMPPTVPNTPSSPLPSEEEEDGCLSLDPGVQICTNCKFNVATIGDRHDIPRWCNSCYSGTRCIDCSQPNSRQDWKHREGRCIECHDKHDPHYMLQKTYGPNNEAEYRYLRPEVDSDSCPSDCECNLCGYHASDCECDICDVATPAFITEKGITCSECGQRDHMAINCEGSLAYLRNNRVLKEQKALEQGIHVTQQVGHTNPGHLWNAYKQCWEPAPPPAPEPCSSTDSQSDIRPHMGPEVFDVRQFFDLEAEEKSKKKKNYKKPRSE